MKYWKRINPDGSTATVESYLHNQEIKDAVEITQVEFETFIATLPEPPLLPDWPTLYATARTDKERLTVIAQMLGLVDFTG